jgi:peptidoglycan DL-endopeptidase CwlO
MSVSPTGRQRRLSLAVALLTALLTVLGAMTPAHAEDPNTDDEGAPKTLREKLEVAAKQYYDTRSQLVASQKRQAQIHKTLREAELTLARLNVEVAKIAAARYKGGQLGILNGLFTGQGDPDRLLDAAAISEYMVWRDDEQLHRYREARDVATSQQVLLTAEIQNEKKQLAQLDKVKRNAEKALASVGGLVTAGYSGPVPDAQPAPRTASGGWPREKCSVKDPTGTGGCITPRMYHLLTEARLAGFTRFTKCWRSQSWGEHPRGLACDFSANTGNFGGDATGLSKTYGNRLAAWAKNNAEALGVIYVIWYRQIWFPGVGWRSYTSCCDASSKHTNHVHISML